MFGWLRERRRRRVLDAPFPDAWRAVLEDNVEPYTHLAAADRQRLEQLIQIFIDEKEFEGCDGLVIDDLKRVTIAAEACLLILHQFDDLSTPLYPDLVTILVYPHAFRSPLPMRSGPIVIETPDVRLGESWTRGMVVLSWDSVRQGSHNWHDGHNVVLHEFAHQLDAASGDMNGAPVLGASARYTAWARVLGSEYDDLKARLERGGASDIDAYGATSPAEFFAVITEMFFEKPHALERRHPELFGELLDFYRIDPRAWMDHRAP